MGKQRIHKKPDKVSHGAHSMNIDRSNVSGEMRSKSTIRRLRMVRNSKARRNAKGEIVKEAAFQSVTASGTMAHVEPNRKYFGNTRVISDTDLEKFRSYVTNDDPYQVTLKKTLMPLTSMNTTKEKKKPPVINPVPHFKLPKNQQTLVFENPWELSKKTQPTESTNSNVIDNGNNIRPENMHMIFKAGSSHRVYNQLMNVIDSSDVLLYVLDVRDPDGTRNEYVEKLLKDKPAKKLIYVLNKIDLVPIAVTKAWRRHYSKLAPTVAFYANLNHPYGKSTLIGLLRQMNMLMKDRKQISVGIIGYPNVGKSSLINTLKNQKVCNVAPIAGETKVWQFVSLMKSIDLIDCPGVCYSYRDTETDLVLKGAVRVEKVPDPDMFIPALLEKVKPETIKLKYGISENWDNWEELLEKLAKRYGRLLKGGQPDIQTMSRKILNDLQRGDLRYYVKPPGYDNENEPANACFELTERFNNKSKSDKVKETDVNEDDDLLEENENEEQSEKDDEIEENQDNKEDELNESQQEEDDDMDETQDDKDNGSSLVKNDEIVKSESEDDEDVELKEVQPKSSTSKTSSDKSSKTKNKKKKSNNKNKTKKLSWKEKKMIKWQNIRKRR